MAAKRKVVLTGHTAVWQTNQSDYSVGAGLLHELAELQHQMRVKWGEGRLRLLVSPELRSKFDAQREKLSRAEWWGGIDELRLQAGRMRNAWAALDRAATDAGHGPLEPGLWEVTLADGTLLRVARTDADAQRVPLGSGPVWSLEEVGRLISSQPPALLALKDTFRGSTVLEAKPMPEFVDDEPEDIA